MNEVEQIVLEVNDVITMNNETTLVSMGSKDVLSRFTSYRVVDKTVADQIIAARRLLNDNGFEVIEETAFHANTDKVIMSQRSELAISIGKAKARGEDIAPLLKAVKDLAEEGDTQ